MSEEQIKILQNWVDKKWDKDTRLEKALKMLDESTD